jgi:hypothetical protein
MDEFDAVDRRTIPDDAIVCRFSNGRKPASIAVDIGGSVIHFKNCHVPRRFIASAQDCFSCPISHVTGVHRFIYRGESLTIVTTMGKALIPATAGNYVELREFLTKAVSVNEPGFSTDHPMMGMVYLVGGFVGGLFSVLLTPGNASESTLLVFILSGTILGVVGIHLLIRFGHWLKTARED